MTDVQEQPVTVPGFKGQLFRPGDEGYDAARSVFNGMIDRHPALVARCMSTEDVSAVVRAAGEQGLPLSVYGGGHGVTGSAVVEGGICLDTRGLTTIEVDSVHRVANVGGGCIWRDVDAATQEYGLAVTGGRVSTTGVAGLALGSGSGWIERMCGLTCDNLLEVEMVVADGRVVIASATENPDLFWGVRGGGGNFGVVTRFTFQLHEVGPILLAGMLLYPGHMAKDVIRAFRDFIAAAPDEVGGGIALITAPPEDFVPEPARGKPAVGVVLCYVGPVEHGAEALKPMLEFGPPAVNLVQPMPYVAMQQMLDASVPKGLQNYWTAEFLEELPDDAVDVLTDFTSRPVSPLTQVNLLPGGGALSRVPNDATAFNQRRQPWNVHYISMWPDPADTERNIAWTRDLAAAMKPWSAGRAYLNFIGDEGHDRVEAAFGPETYARLRRLKKTWDPGNLFRHNQNIRPAD